jgi:hypothetical protein
VGIDISPLSFYALTQIKQQPGLVLGYGRLPLPNVPGVVRQLAQALELG